MSCVHQNDTKIERRRLAPQERRGPRPHLQRHHAQGRTNMARRDRHRPVNSFNVDTYKKLVSNMKEVHCPKCELNLYCASGRSGGDSFWCTTCNGYFVPGLRCIVQCSGFSATRPRYYQLKVNTLTRPNPRLADRAARRCPYCLDEPTQSANGWRFVLGFACEEHL